MTLAAASDAQVNRSFLSRSGPRPPFQTPEQANYNIRIGKKLKARLYGSVQLEANDNINLSEDDPQFDVSVAPNGRIGFVWPIDDLHTLQFNLGAGYRWYLNSPSISSVTIDPSSRLEHRMTIGDVQVELFDSFSVQADPSSQGELSGTEDSLINFRRLRNTSGFLLSWQPNSKSTLSGGYDYAIDRSLSGQFTSLDRDEHSINASLFFIASQRSYIGLSGDYSVSLYNESVQNDGARYSAGPVWIYHLTRFITLRSRVAYSAAEFEPTGSIADRSDFSGVSYSGEIQHEMNSRMKHSIQFSRGASLGLGSNFTDTLAVQYDVQATLGPFLKLNSNFAYETLEVSGPGGEAADRFLFYLGTGFQLTKRWMVGLGYALALKDSDQAGRDYSQNRFTIDMTRQF